MNRLNLRFIQGPMVSILKIRPVEMYCGVLQGGRTRGTRLVLVSACKQGLSNCIPIDTHMHTSINFGTLNRR